MHNSFGVILFEEKVGIGLLGIICVYLLMKVELALDIFMMCQKFYSASFGGILEPNLPYGVHL